MTGQTKPESSLTKLGPLKRNVRLLAGFGEASDVQIGVVDVATRTITMSFSSETPCPAQINDQVVAEVLSHLPGAARMQRINAGAPLLFNHDLNDLLGVIERAWIGADKRGYCTVRFGSDARGDWAMGQVQDSILQNVSFYYRVYAYQTDLNGEVYTATSWEPTEISFVTVPADFTVGVGRAAATDLEMDVEIVRPQAIPAPAGNSEPAQADDPELAQANPPELAQADNPEPAQADNPEGSDMFKKKHVKQDVAEAARSAGGVPGAAAAVQVDPAAAEHARVTEIEAMCKQHAIAEETRNLLVTLRQPIEAARGIVLNEVLARGRSQASMGGSSNPDLSAKEKARYSMLRAINGAVNERMNLANPWKEAGLEREVSIAIGQRSGKHTAGVYIPTNLQFAARSADYSVGTGAGLSANSGGGNLVQTNLMAGSMIELLRNKARVFGLGAQMLSGLTGNIDIPRQKAAGQTYWVGEGQTLNQAGAQFDKISMSPKHIGALSVITRNMLLQSTPDIDMLARADLLTTLALGIDLAALSGTGLNNQPIGIANLPGVNQIMGGANGSLLTIDDLIDMETAVADANADSDSMAYLCNARTVGALKKLKSTTGEYLWTNSPQGQRSGTPGEINGYTVARSNQARKNLTKGAGTNLSELFFGDWSQVLVGEWGVVEVLPNPYVSGLYEQGAIELRVLQTLDIAVRHEESFSVKSDAQTQ